MQDPKHITIDDYNYPLPDDRIAKYPLPQRDQSKLLVWRRGQITQTIFAQLPDNLPSESMLVFNDTKVIHARLLFRKVTGTVIELFCLEPWQQSLAEAFSQTEHCCWLCFVGNNKRWKEGALQRQLTIAGRPIVLTATRCEAQGNAWVVDFRWSGQVPFATLIDQAGVIPLPPYLHRASEASDNERYQTVYATHEGSVAAPTAGLHFTEAVFDSLRRTGIETDFVTLHVGAGTFKPVNTPTIGEHEMHVEKVLIARSLIEHVLSHQGKPLVAVGTTSVRTLESLYWFGVKLLANPNLSDMQIRQWDPYQLAQQVSTTQALQQVLHWMDKQQTEHLLGDTQLLIAPGYHYHIIDGLITNFHQPKSTLLLLVAALIGDGWRECYRYALSHDFRFLSYGDSCLLLP